MKQESYCEEADCLNRLRVKQERCGGCGCCVKCQVNRQGLDIHHGQGSEA